MRVLRVAALIGVALEGLKYLFLFAWPWLNLKLENEYGPFKFSASLIILSMVASLLVLAGAEWSARAQPSILSPDPAPDAATENSDLVSVQDSDRRVQ
jgi:hypothetical protein